jgi:type I restriction enzyme S subunit
LCFIKNIEQSFNKYSNAIERQIRLMTEYRTRLISDVVTGKIDVRGIEILEY